MIDEQHEEPEYCIICGIPLDDDNLYGSDEFPECRDHHGWIEYLQVTIISGGKITLPEFVLMLEGRDVTRAT